MRLPRWLRDPFYPLLYRFHPKYQFHIVRTGLKPGYADQDVRMMHAMFALLLDHIEEDGGVEKIEAHAAQLESGPAMWFGHKLSDDRSSWTVDDWAAHFDSADAMKSHVDSRREKLALYRWWITERQPAWDAYYALCHERYSGITLSSLFRGEDEKPDMTGRPSFDETHDLMDQLEAKDDEMLRRLLVIRRSLWT